MIRRDGSCTSVWQDGISPYEPARQADSSTLYDCIIVGGGITGITTALLLQQEGKRCMVLEANTLCFGTTGGTTAHLNTLLDTPYTTIQQNFGKDNAHLVAATVAEAIGLIRHHVEWYQIDCGFADKEAYLFATETSQEATLEEMRVASEEAGLILSYTDQIPVPVPFTKALRVEGQAQFHPVQYVYALAKELEAAGGTIVQECRVTGISPDRPVQVLTTKGNFNASHLVYATHIPPGVNLLHLRCVPYRSYAMAVTLANNQYPDGLSYDMDDPYHYYRTQEVAGQRYLIAGGEDHKTGHEENTLQCFRQLESHLRKHFEIEKVHYQWSSQYFEPVDGLPYIGRLPGQEDNIYVATGYGGNGMVYGTAAALLLKKMIMGEIADTEKLFSPSRIKPVAGFTQFVSHNAAVVKQFFGKLFSGDKLTQLASLAPGEGKVVTYDDHKIALHKTAEGTLYAISPACTHLKCDVQWNTAEQSWDCPCHGARYHYDGTVLTGPADIALEPVPLSSNT